MKAWDLLQQIEKMGVQVIAGVPDSTLKQFCDGLQLYQGNLKHYVAANEGAAVGIAVGTYLSSGHPACVYLQNSGIGNMINPIASLANKEVYGIPMLFLVGWRGEPGVKDEPQHAYQGKITCELFEVMSIPYSIVDGNTSSAELENILRKADEAMAQNLQYAIIVKKGTFEKTEKFVWSNGNVMNREWVLGEIIKMIPGEACIVSTTGKISRELYEQSNQMRGNHDALFMTVGGMGHASMIAFGIAQDDPSRKVFCIDGDGAALMHMGAFPFLAENAPENFIHIVVNNQAHESVGAMPTGCGQVKLAELAKAAGYRFAARITDPEELKEIAQNWNIQKGPCLYEIMVSLESRADLCRPAESARENRDHFMRYLQDTK